MGNLSPAREAAFRILLQVEKGQAHSDDLLRARFVSRMMPVDRNLTTALVLGTLRWQIALDREVKQYLAKPNAKLDTEVRIALRLGALQLLRMERIPAHAAIAECVELVKRAGHSFAARMVNAVLRKLAQAQADALPAHNHSEQEKTEAVTPTDLAHAFAHPAWLVERWVRQYGPAQTQAICAHGQQQAALHVRMVHPDVAEQLRGEGIQLAPAELLADARTLIAGDLVRTNAFHAVQVRLQDEGSQLVAELAAACAPAGTQKICDSCAAPGGKTLILAERHNKAQITACELSAPRAEELAKRLAPLAPRVHCRACDASTLAAGEAFDLILVDAPCSGTGTMGRNPEIRHRLQPEEFARQAERQYAILAAALGAVRVGGRVLYSTCSLEPEENEDVVARALAAQHNVRQISLAAAIDTLDARGLLTEGTAHTLQAAFTPEGALRLLPGSSPTDGFFMALFECVAEQ